MSKIIFSFLILYCFSLPSLSQSEKLKLETGISFSVFRSLENDFLNSRDYKTNIGISSRFTYHFTNNFAGETETTFFISKKNAEFQRPIISVFGIRAGQRREKFGLFAKARPGFVTYTEAVVCAAIFPGSCPNSLRSTKFVLDLGGVVEFYPSRHLVTRIDIGDTMIRNNNATRHHLQTNIGIGWRF